MAQCAVDTNASLLVELHHLAKEVKGQGVGVGEQRLHGNLQGNIQAKRGKTRGVGDMSRQEDINTPCSPPSQNMKSSYTHARTHMHAHTHTRSVLETLPVTDLGPVWCVPDLSQHTLIVDGAEFLRQGGPKLLNDQAQLVAGGGPAEQGLATQDLRENTADGPHIYPCGVRVALTQQLGGAVPSGHHVLCQLAGGLESAREAQVGAEVDAEVDAEESTQAGSARVHLGGLQA